jgi:hypothetical protein
MARNASGEYTLPSGNPVVTDTQITSTWGNTTLSDVATEMTASLSRTGKGGMLAPLKTINGTVSAPVYTFTNFPTSGLYIAGAGDVRMSVTGVDRMRWLASGSATQVRNAAEDEWTDIGSVLLTNEATDTTCFPIFATAATGNLNAKTNTTFTFNSNTGAVGIGGSLKIDPDGTLSSTGILQLNQSGDTKDDAITLKGSNATTHRLWKSANGSFNLGPADSPSAFIQTTTGAITTTGNVNGRDMAADGTKLDTLSLVPDSGAVGDIGLFYYNGASNVAVNTTVAGSTLRFSTADGSSFSGTPSGTWRCQGRAGTNSSAARVTLFIRVS